MLRRTFGLATAAYGLYALARPDHLSRHGGLGDPDRPDAGVRTLSRVIGVRDLISGATIAARPGPGPLALRAAFDLGDAAVFGTQLPTPRARRTVAVVASGWGALALLLLLRTRR
jgi:hypothetical protein